MKRKVYVHQYVMFSRTGLNSRSRATEHVGALIRVDVDDVSGYACLHPWVELGDLSLEELLSHLAVGRMSRQIKCAIECADADRSARLKGVSLFSGLDVPLSHATIVGGIEKVELAVEAGFDTVKLKMGRDIAADVSLLKEVNTNFPELMIRIDFNGMVGFSELEILLNEIGEVTRRRLDYIEDPLAIGDNRWSLFRDQYGLKVGIDRGVEDIEGEFDISVVKPAINDLSKIASAAQKSRRSMVVTSYMDHPIGQSYAAYCAGMLNSSHSGIVNPRCGLLTHGLYEPTDFTILLGGSGPKWSGIEGASGIGLGFDDLLEKLDWKKI